MAGHVMEKLLTFQGESSHSRTSAAAFIQRAMKMDEVFRRNLVRLRLERGYNRAELSRLAGLSPHGVKDIEEGKSQSPKLSTVIALAKALECDAGELIGLGPRPRLRDELVQFLETLDEDAQGQLLAALRAIPAPRD